LFLFALLTADSSSFLPCQNSNDSLEQGVLVLEDQAGKNLSLLVEVVQSLVLVSAQQAVDRLKQGERNLVQAEAVRSPVQVGEEGQSPVLVLDVGIDCNRDNYSFGIVEIMSLVDTIYSDSYEVTSVVQYLSSIQLFVCSRWSFFEGIERQFFQK